MTIETIETWLKVVALIAAASFFTWKVWTGWLIINLQVSLDVKRQNYDEKNDLLAIQLNLKKGSTDTLWIKDASIRVTTDGPSNQQKIIPISELTEFAVTDGKIDWNAPNRNGKKITLSPDESTQFATTTVVPRGTVARVEAAIFGNRTFWNEGFQWRASSVSLPVAKEGTPK